MDCFFCKGSAKKEIQNNNDFESVLDEFGLIKRKTNTIICGETGSSYENNVDDSGQAWLDGNIKELKEIKQALNIVPGQNNETKLSVIVNNITGRRDKVIVHTDRDYFDNPDKLDTDFPISVDDIKCLIEFARDVLNFSRGCFQGYNYNFDHMIYRSGLLNLLGCMHNIKFDVWGNNIEDKIRELRFPKSNYGR